MELQFPLIITCLLFFLIVFVKRCISSTQNSNSKLPPGPWLKLPIIGHLHYLTGLPHRSLHSLSNKYGPLMLLQLGEISAVVVSSPRVAKEIMQTHDLTVADRPELLSAEIMSYNYKGIVFCPYGEFWRQLKKICILEVLSQKRVKSFWSIREEEVSIFVERISAAAAGSTVNLSQMFNSLTTDIISRAAFGMKCNHKEDFISLMDEIVLLSGGFDMADLFPSSKFLSGIGGTKLKLEKIHGKMDKILEDIIDEHRRHRGTNSSRTENAAEDLVDVLLRIQQENDFALRIENDNIKAVLLDVFGAGSETSSTAMSWTMAEMIRNPRVLEKAQAEVRHVLNGKTKVTQSDIDELSYLRCVIKESFRLHPPLPLLIPRQCREKCEIDGYEIPKGTKVIVNACALGIDPEVWSNSEQFLPERFEDLSVDYKGTNFEYIPFGGGRRICPGIAFGVANVELPLAQLLYHFNWKIPNGVKPAELDMTESSGITVKKKFDLNLIPTLYNP